MHTRAAAWTVLIVLLATTAASTQRTADERTTCNQPVEPFRIFGNIHYVGAAGVSAFLITSEDGSVLLDGGLPETAPLVVRNMSSLGFRIGDVKYLLNSHAHFDHAGGLAELRRLSGATVVASAGDAGALRAGGPNMPAVEVGRVIEDGGTVRVGKVTLTARITPGHTKGCTTWTTTATEKGRKYEVLFYCSTSVVDRLVDNAAYPEILRDYERTFAKLRTLEADAFLANHPAFFDLESKRRRLTPDANPFIDAGELRRYVDESERQFRLELRKQQSAPTVRTGSAMTGVVSLIQTAASRERRQKKASSDHVPGRGTLYGRGREVHAWQTPPGVVARQLPSTTRNGRLIAGRFSFVRRRILTPPG